MLIPQELQLSRFPCRLLVYRHCKCAGYSSKDQFVVLVKYDAQFEF